MAIPRMSANYQERSFDTAIPLLIRPCNCELFVPALCGSYSYSLIPEES